MRVRDLVQRGAFLSRQPTEAVFTGNQEQDAAKYNADGSLTIYAGATSPGTDKETNWLPAPDGAFSLYIRAYWPEQAALDGTWKPPIIEKVK